MVLYTRQSNFGGQEWLMLKEPNDNLLHINKSSDHPPQIIKQLTNSINKRLYVNSANEQVFNIVKPVYENDLHKSGYKSSLNSFMTEAVII